ncbi:dynactin [Aspergillus sp. HF37]|nr:dynactin [Aspergillus sp. HF37]
MMELSRESDISIANQATACSFARPPSLQLSTALLENRNHLQRGAAMHQAEDALRLVLPQGRQRCQSIPRGKGDSADVTEVSYEVANETSFRESINPSVCQRHLATVRRGIQTEAVGRYKDLYGPPSAIFNRSPRVTYLISRHNEQSDQTWRSGYSVDVYRSPGGAEGAANSQSEEPSEGDSQRAEGEAAEQGEPTSKMTRPTPGSGRTGAARLGQSPSSSQRQVQNSAVTRELDELRTKLRVMEKKRSEDRDRLKTLEQLQSERDKFEGIIQKLQTKYQPQQQEVGELQHESLMEMAALDREMAEETADAFKQDCEALRAKVEELQLELDVLREENDELGQVMSPEEKSSHGWVQMEKTNERLREALIRLRDMTQHQETDLKDHIKELEQDLEDYAAIKSQYEATKEKLLVAETNCDDLKQQLETALGAEEMIEELADKNMRYQEQINELHAAIEDLEALKEISDELEYNHIETEKQLQDEIDYREGVFNEQCRKISQQDEVIEDLEYTMTRFRELVSTLQGDLEDMRATQQISETEANDLTTRSRSMMDLNTKLQASVAKAQTKTIDVELGRMDAEEAIQHLSILKLYLPEYFEGEKNSVLALLRFKRVGFKASLMNNAIRERMSEQSSISTLQEEFFSAHDVLEKLLWMASLCDRFVNYVNCCSAESFGDMKGVLFELEPVERTLNFWIEGLKKNDFNIKKCAMELQRSIALLSHLAETVLPNSPEAFADELCMRSLLAQSCLDHAASSISKLKSLIQTKVMAPEEGSEGSDEGGNFVLGKMDSFVSQSRGLKVAMGKIYRSVDELRSRSLALPIDTAGPFNKAEEATKELSELSRQLGENILLLVTEEGRTEPFTLEEALNNMSQTSIAFAQSAEPGTENDDAMSELVNRLRSIARYLEELDSVSSDLSITSEFEKRAHPWIARAEELKSNKAISPDADEEIHRLKNEIHEASTTLSVKDKTIEEQAIKVELVESRMREATKKASMVNELEAKIEEIQSKKSELVGTVDSQRKELQDMEAERDEYISRLERVKRASGTTGVATDGAVVDGGASLATMRENEALRSEVESLQAAVRFLREENRRANMLDPYSVQRSADMHSWLDVPLTQANTGAEREKAKQSASESRDVFAHLLKLTQESHTKLRYQVLQQREDYERWAEWRDDIVDYEREQDRLAAAKKERALREQFQKHAHRHSAYGEFPQGHGHGMMGRAWRILGMQHGDRKHGHKAKMDSVEIVT